MTEKEARQLIKRFIPLMTTRADDHLGTLLDGKPHQLLSQLQAAMNVKVTCTSYIEPNILKNCHLPECAWKLRHVRFDNVAIDTQKLVDELSRDKHPYYKKIEVIRDDITFKLYSVESNKNKAISTQKNNWGDMLKMLNSLDKPVMPEILHWFPNIDVNLHAIVYKTPTGRTLHDKYATIGKKFETQHPDTIAGALPPYWATVSTVRHTMQPRLIRIVCDLFVMLYNGSKSLPLTAFKYQDLSKEPDWEKIWKQGDDRRMINVDDWRLQNIMETDDNEYLIADFDRATVTDPTNGIIRFVADFRNQTNLTINPERLAKCL